MIIVFWSIVCLIYYTDVLFDGIRGEFKKRYFLPFGKWVYNIQDFLMNLGSDKW